MRMTVKVYRKFLSGVIFLALIMTPNLCQAEPYVELYAGPNFATNMDPSFDFSRGMFFRTAKDVAVDPSFIIGGKFGYWFNKESFPAWMKYFGVELDISYNPLNWPSQKVLVDPINTKFDISNKGYSISTVLLFLFRYGFLPDQEVPFGRLQPYVGIGPMLFYTYTKLGIGFDFRSNEADPGFAVESGIRYMLRKNISLNIGFRYRRVLAHVDTDDTIFDADRHYIVMQTTYNLFNVMLGAAYHF